ncbi:hypothetical protein BDW22DRAFT_26541 [Trametopsis cervina]|nr:hypothetical protein BDW22DRAFT_26541 [Trametopsis cervina]
MPGKLIQPVSAAKDSKSKDITSVVEVDMVSALKATREHEHGRNSALKAARRKKKGGDPKVLRVLPTPRSHIVRGWELRDDEDEDEEMGDTDWVAAVDRDERPDMHEVPLAELLKPAKPRHRDQKAGDFEVVPGMPTVIALDEQMVPGPEAVEEDWETLDFVNDDQDSRSSYQMPSYAEVAANAT